MLAFQQFRTCEIDLRFDADVKSYLFMKYRFTRGHRMEFLSGIRFVLT